MIRLSLGLQRAG